MSHDHDPDFTNPKHNGQAMDGQQTTADVLAAHQQERGIRDTRVHCLCGWESKLGGQPFRADIHREHQVAMLEPVIRDREAKAWDEGVKTTLNHAIDNEDGITLRLEHLDGRPWQNPYRDDQ